VALIEEKVYTLLAAALPASGVAASRIKPPGVQQDLTAPYVIYFVVNTGAGYTYGEGLERMRAYLLQVSVYAASYSSARTISEAVITAMTGQHDVVQYFFRDLRYLPEQGAQDAGIKLYHIALDFEAWAAL
jgi:FtsH-binding integral membrane protein